MIKNVLNGDGLVLGFYGILWLKLKELEEQALTSFILPHTIIFSNSIPTQWFYSNPQGVILRKKQTSITKENLIQNLVSSPNDICAYFISQQSEKQNVLEYIKGEELSSFLDGSQHQNGILQQFIQPIGQYNSQIQIVWASHLIIFNKRTNLNKITDEKVPIHQRLATFDGNQALSIESTVLTQALSLLLQKTAIQISQHIEAASYGQHITQGMVYYVKIDQNKKIIFLYCTSARTNFFQKDSKKNPPITLHQKVIHDPNKYNSQPCFYTKSKAIKLLDCVSCCLRQDPQDMFNCKLWVLIDQYEREQNPPIDNNDTQKPKKIQMKRQKQNIPSLVLKLLPKITQKDFEEKIDLIRNLKIYVCGECYLKYRVQEKEHYKYKSFSTQFRINEKKYTNLVQQGLAVFRNQSQQDIKKSYSQDFINQSFNLDQKPATATVQPFIATSGRPTSAYIMNSKQSKHQSSLQNLLSEMTSNKSTECHSAAQIKLKNNQQNNPYLDVEVNAQLQTTLTNSLISPKESSFKSPKICSTRFNLKWRAKI